MYRLRSWVETSVSEDSEASVQEYWSAMDLSCNSDSKESRVFKVCVGCWNQVMFATSIHSLPLFCLAALCHWKIGGVIYFTLSACLLHSQVRACSNLKSLSSPSRTENFRQPSRKEAFFCRSMHSSNAAATFWRFAKDFSNLLAVPLLPNRSTNGTSLDLGKAFEGQWQPQPVR